MGQGGCGSPQVLINLYTLFGLFGEPLSQAAQAMLPPLLEKKAEKTGLKVTGELIR